ncbi:hypothetical protein M440DRAFT_242783 [Trichoderma longibrachiatum ATCC 18648]|uniref:Uncharacterized protein n=1 Tax=Trichoderma longibrachiatum ATCC 18648 TaxID=983965 RepID=A0A2T4CDJ9_TRILO|nr:hypothetical protein M440DRAFT_242783 [Trichoderma longibrachiatum ATCC 18648]
MASGIWRQRTLQTSRLQSLCMSLSASPSFTPSTGKIQISFKRHFTGNHFLDSSITGTPSQTSIFSSHSLHLAPLLTPLNDTPLTHLSIPFLILHPSRPPSTARSPQLASSELRCRQMVISITTHK